MSVSHYRLSISPRRRDETFATLTEMAHRILDLAREPRGLRLESRKTNRRAGAEYALAVIDGDSGEFIANLFVGPRPTAMIGPVRDAIRLAADFRAGAARRDVPADDRHPAVAAFLDQVAHLRHLFASEPGRYLQGVAVEAFAMKGVGLVARVTALPPGHIADIVPPSPALAGGYSPLLSRDGEACWNALFTLGRAAVAATLNPARDLFALTLSPAAVDAARRQVQPEAA